MPKSWPASKVLSHLDRSKYRVINNAVLGLKEKTIHIDYIVISKYGVFIIETKNYNGSITGEENDEYWTETSNGEEYRFSNPVKKILYHVQLLKNNLSDSDKINFVPVIVFPGNTNVKVRATIPVVNVSCLFKTIKKYNESIMPYDEVESLNYKISSMNLNLRHSILHHIAAVEREKQKGKNKPGKDICPKCGGNLVIKKDRYGYYKGCSNYPTCRFTGRI